MSPRRKIAGLLLSLLMLTYNFHEVMLALAGGRSFDRVTAGNEDIEFLKKLANAAPPEDPPLEHSYIIPSGMNLSLADEIWLKIAPLISLGYGEEEIVKTIGESGLPRKVKVDNASVLLDYANLHVTHNLENGEVSVEIPVLCNSSLPSIYYEVKGVKKSVKLFNVTSIGYYNVSVRTPDLCEVTYRREGAGKFSEAILDLKGDLKNNMISVYFPDLDRPVFSEVCFNLPPYGVSLNLRILEWKVYDIGFGGERVDCFWIHVNVTLRASRDVFRTMLRMGHGGGWVVKPRLILRKGGYASDHWVKWTPNDKLIVEFFIEGFGNMFILNFGETTETRNDFLSRILSEDELKSLLEQPPYQELNLSRAPKSLRMRFVGEKVINETLWITDEEYEQLVRLGWRKGKSFFIDSGETKWEYAVTNRTLGQCESIRLFYNPLKVNRGELVHGLTLRNYARTNVSYTLRLRTTTSFLFFFSKVEEGNGGITINGSSMSHLLLVQQEPAVGDAVLELVNDGRIVAAVKVYLVLKATMYWKGFWDGLATKLPGIMVTAGVMIAIGFLIPHAYVRPVYYLLLGLGVLMNLAEVALDVAEANKAKEEMLTLAEAFENRSSEFLARGEAEHAAECASFALALRREVDETTNNLLLNVLSGLTIGVSFDEIKIALSLEEPLARNEFEKQYKIGYARGRVTGAVISCALYVTLFTMVNRIKAERAGQRLTAGRVLKLIARGIYNWITPAVWDAVVLMRGKIGGFTNSIIDLLLGNKYSSRFGEALGRLLQDAKGKLPRINDALDASSEISKQVLENVPSRESSSKILDAIGSIIENYSPGEMKEKGKTVMRSIVSMWIKDGDGAIESLNSWLSVNSKNMDRMKALDDILLKIEGDAAKGVGLKIGDIVDTYLNIKNKYGESIGEAFLDKALRNPSALTVLNSMGCFIESHMITVKRAEEGEELVPQETSLVLAEESRLEPGNYRVRVYWQYDGKNGIAEFPVSLKTVTNRIHIPTNQVDEILNNIDDVNEARITVSKLEYFDYRLFFPTKFSAMDAGATLDLFNDKLKKGGKEYSFEKIIDHSKGRFLVKATFYEARNLDGNSLTLTFYENDEIRIVYGIYIPVREVQIDSVNDAMWIRYLEQTESGIEVEETAYSFKSGDLDSQIGKKLVWEEAVSSERQVGLMKKLLVLLGYDAFNRLRQNMGTEYVVIVEFDKGKAYTGSSKLAVSIPEGATKIESIFVISIKGELEMHLKRILENPYDTKATADDVAYVGEYVVSNKYQDAITDLIARKTATPLNELKHKVTYEWLGVRALGEHVTDILVKAAEDITIEGVAFKKGDVIAIVEVKSTTNVDNVENFEKIFRQAKSDLKRYIDVYPTARYGITAVFAFDPYDMLMSMSYPDNVGAYGNPYVEIFPIFEMIGGD